MSIAPEVSGAKMMVASTTEQALPTANPQPKPRKGCTGALLNVFDFFVNGPIFRVITEEMVTANPSGQIFVDDLAKVEETRRRKDAAKFDKGDKTPYGIDKDDIMYLPYQPPAFYEYLVEMGMGAFQIVQYIAVMLVAIMIESDQWRLKAAKSEGWIYEILKSVLILYPAVTMTMLIMTTCEYVYRRFMYYRLMSLRILVDWTNHALWHGWFFWYFVITWIMLNIWAIASVIQFWGRETPGKPDSVSLGTFVVVNIQTLQLLIYYNKLQHSEDTLLTMNLFIESAPAEAQRIIDHTYFVKEEFVKRECMNFDSLCRDAIRQRLTNIATCGWAGRAWKQHYKAATFDIGRIIKEADNKKIIEEHDANRRKLAKATAQGSASLNMVEESGTIRALPAIELSNTATPPVDIGPATIKPATPPTDNAGNAFTFQDPRESLKHHTRYRGLKKVGVFIYDIAAVFPRMFNARLYATVHSFMIGFMPGARSWPYRKDVLYFRFMVVMQILSVLIVAGTLAYGILMAKSNTCSKGTSACGTCSDYIQHNVVRDHICPADTQGQISLLEAIRNSTSLWPASQANFKKSFKLT